MNKAIALTEKQVKKFQVLYRERFGKELSKRRAYEEGVRLVELIKLSHEATVTKQGPHEAKKR